MKKKQDENTDTQGVEVSLNKNEVNDIQTDQETETIAIPNTKAVAKTIEQEVSKERKPSKHLS